MFVRGVIASCLALVAVAALPTEAQPHAWTDFYDTRWRPEARPVKWVVAPSIHLHFPEWMPYIKHGANQTNAIGSTMQFAYGGLAPGECDDCGLAGLSLVRRQDTGYLPDGRVVWADTTVCPDPVVGRHRFSCDSPRG